MDGITGLLTAIAALAFGVAKLVQAMGSTKTRSFRVTLGLGKIKPTLRIESDND